MSERKVAPFGTGVDTHTYIYITKCKHNYQFGQLRTGDTEMKLEECKEAEPEKAVPEVAEGEKDGKEGNKKNQEEPEEARSQRRLL